jgi:hypothetical protein
MFAEDSLYAAGVGFITSLLSHLTLGIGTSLQYKTDTVRVLVTLLEVMLVAQKAQRVLVAASELAIGQLGIYPR